MIRVPNWVGDAVMAVPALRELRRIFAGSHITLVARPWVAGLFDGEALADDLIPTADASGPAQPITRLISDARRLRRGRFDLAVLLQNAFGAALAARAAGVPTVAGYPTDGRRWLLGEIVPFEPGYKTRHQVFYYLNIAAHVEKRLTGESRVEMLDAHPRLGVTQEQKDKARQMLGEQGIEGAASPILVLSPGATNSRAKQWLPERFAETADTLTERDGFQTIIVGAAADLEVASRVARRMRTKATVMAGKTSVADLKAVLACSSLVVSNDTGTAHVSAALGVPTVVVFGPTEHEVTSPLSDAAAVVRHPVHCSPCMLRDCPIDHRCMTRIEVDEVYRAARRLLAVREKADSKM
jgi:lipopolysaccharide heptosyltransferase II